MSVSHPFTARNNYTVTLSVRDAAGNMDTDAVAITATARPIAPGRDVVPPVAIGALGLVALLELGLALRLASPRLRERARWKKKEREGGSKEKEERPKEREGRDEEKHERDDEEFEL